MESTKSMQLKRNTNRLVGTYSKTMNIAGKCKAELFSYSLVEVTEKALYMAAFFNYKRTAKHCLERLPFMIMLKNIKDRERQKVFSATNNPIIFIENVQFLHPIRKLLNQKYFKLSGKGAVFYLNGNWPC